MDTLKVAATQPQARKAPQAKPAAKLAAPKAQSAMPTDVAKFGVLPLSGAPMVSAHDDETLGNLDPINKVLSKLETMGGAGALVSKTARLFTRVVGPSMYSVSAYLNIKRTKEAWRDKNLSTGSKVALTAGTTGTTLGAACAVVSTLPTKLANFLRIGSAGKIVANKLSGIFGGVGGMIFSTINLVETLHRKDAKPAERFFSKASFALGAIGFVAGTAALAISMPQLVPAMGALASKLPWLLPTVTKVANITGIAGMVSWGAQNFLGKNQWLNDKLKGTALA